MTDNLETGLFDDASGNPPTAANGVTPLVTVNQTNGIPLKQVLTANQPGVTNKAGNPSITTVAGLQAAWDGHRRQARAMQTPRR
jgi:hypothetical protein